jgi:hypothetical protein
MANEPIALSLRKAKNHQQLPGNKRKTIQVSNSENNQKNGDFPYQHCSPANAPHLPCQGISSRNNVVHLFRKRYIQRAALFM